MIPSQEFIESAASQTGYQASSLKKVIRLGDLAGDITRHPLLGKGLVLKGGTALNLGFGPPSRLSVDLDFNYVGSIDRDQMIKERPLYENVLIVLAERKGYVAQQSPDTFAGRKIFCQYQSVLGPIDRVEIDLNYIFRLPLDPAGARELWQPGEILHPRVMTVGPIELFVGKFLAAIDRSAARDVWDIGQVSRSTPELLHSRDFRAMFIAFSAILDHPLSTYSIDRIKSRLDPLSIEMGLLPMLTVDNQVEVETVLQRAYKFIAPFLKLSTAEQDYVNGVAEGRLQLELLFPKSILEAERLSQHPALLWKIMNVNQARN